MHCFAPHTINPLLLRTLFFVVVFLVLLLIAVPVKNASANNWCGDGFSPTEVNPIVFTKKKPLTLQVTGYPSFGIDDSRQSLNDIAGDQQTQNVSTIVAYLYNAVLVISAIIAFLSVLYVGVMYVVSGANPALRGQALGRLKKIFIGIAIVLFSVLILNEINPELTRTGGFDLIEQEKVADPYTLPGGGNPVEKRRDLTNSIQEGLPFSSSQSTESEYVNLVIPFTDTENEEDEDTCRKCNAERSEEDGLICSPFCYDKNPSDYNPKDDERRSLERQRDQYMVIGLDRLKCFLEQETKKEAEKRNPDYTSWALVKDDDNPIVSCVAACAVIKEVTNEENKTITEILSSETTCQDDSDREEYEETLGRGINKIQGAVDKAFEKENDTYKNRNPEATTFKKIGDEEEYIEDDQWYDGEIPGFDNGYIFWGDTNSAGRNSLHLHDGTSDEFVLSRAPLRQCIRDHLLYDAQDWPSGIVGNTDVDICLCK
ncbi:MAG: hypothetical protein F4X82_02520 [Candidatus Spechtbacteria bacterium SB0662_bin_43]|uniref:Uncharacterized protein n=1 Tax=Candidatus Spechtbacteria bacterium SB0662_bin_43 TaxID=2604897 RepID=A0A845DM06_9BACT|nr:hypothetical protein [Candidatus Spechtbacteria bacterium SB0662_bin_43]